MSVSQDRASKIVKFAKKHGVNKTAKKFKLSPETVTRYARIGSKPKADYVADVGKGFRNDDHNRVLVIGDLHAPFDLEEYFDHCIAVYDKYECNRVIFIGDIIDNHFSSYHETDADGMGGKQELDLAVARLKRWYDAFPDADIILGNHDRMVMRKAQTSAIPTVWIKDYKDVLNTPRWNFIDNVICDNVLYVHGEGGQAVARSMKDQISVVQGHFHVKCFTNWHAGINSKMFAMQVGCGINKDSYAMAYAKNFGTPVIGCGVVLNGKVAINEVMSVN